MWSRDNDVVRDAALMTPNAYMQLVGIVQALAVGVLVQQAAVFDLIESGRGDLLSAEFWLVFFQASVAFQLIVLAWHVNVQTITAFQRVLGLADSYIPFSFIFAEYFMVTNSIAGKFREWALAVAVFMLIALAAYLHLFLRAHRDFKENEAVLDRIGNYPAIMYAFFGGGAAFAFGVYLADPLDQAVQALSAGAIDVALLVFTYVHVHRFWLPVVRTATLKKVPWR
ncbi:MAG TPA: hypothetical protein VEU06_06275 [Micropepsaceae bacterium]|nr:hypothetical protein [Micropepsaceae bacterium]